MAALCYNKPMRANIWFFSVVFLLGACQNFPKNEANRTLLTKDEAPKERKPSSYVSIFNCQAQKSLPAENEEEAKRLFLAYMNNGTAQPGSVKVNCRNGESAETARGASNICETSVGTCFVNTAQPVGSPCGCAGYPGSIAPQR